MGFREILLGIDSSVSPGFHVVKRDTTDVLEQADAVPFWSQDYTQLAKGSFTGSVNSISYNGIQIFTETMNRAVDQIASAPQDCYVIGLPTIIEGEASWGLLPVRAHSLITLDKNAELYFKTSMISEITVAVIPAKRLEEYAEKMDWIDFRMVMNTIKPVESLNPHVAKLLLTTLMYGMEFDTSNEQDINLKEKWESFEDDLMSACLHALFHASANTHPHFDHRIPRYIVNRVRSSTLTNAAFPLSIEELCKVLKVSRRTLNHAFIRVLGITPVTYMRNVRLQRIRLELMSAPKDFSSIAHVASKWGFWHMSLFSRYYRELFGECPIDTLQRAKSLK
ncbi:MAG: helix-turn-helix domain-containing protein [Methylophilus sp.]|uniref:helix-turn-helix domain-containing protein n=1 Tax=Methylophilus sp. TaxID=29541 RepID=UPI003FA07656